MYFLVHGKLEEEENSTQTSILVASSLLCIRSSGLGLLHFFMRKVGVRKEGNDENNPPWHRKKGKNVECVGKILGLESLEPVKSGR